MTTPFEGQRITIESDHEVRYEIRCIGKCDCHLNRVRVSASLSRGTSRDYARTLYERHAAEYPASGPYWLVEITEQSSVVEEVLEA